MKRNHKCFNIARHFGKCYASKFVGTFVLALLFQHDYAQAHKSRSIKTCLDESGGEELDWPAQSPDLKPTEHL